MTKNYPVYKGLQKPLIYKGFQGKFIGWGLGFFVAGLILGAVIGSLTSMALGGIITLFIIVGGLAFTSEQQKKGQHSKTRYEGVFQVSMDFKKMHHVNKKEKSI